MLWSLDKARAYLPYAAGTSLSYLRSTAECLLTWLRNFLTCCEEKAILAILICPNL